MKKTELLKEPYEAPEAQSVTLCAREAILTLSDPDPNPVGGIDFGEEIDWGIF